MKVAIYSGSIPSTTFVERLICSLAENDIEILLHGLKTQKVRYSTNKIKVIGYTGNFSKTWIGFKFFLLFLFTNPAILLQFRKIFLKNNNSQTFLTWFVRTAPIIWYKPDIFHLQWAKGIEDWIFLRDFGIKFVLSLRGAQINYSPIVEQKFAASYPLFFPKVDAFHGVSQSICQEANKYGAVLDKCRVIYSGLNMREFSFNQEKPFIEKRIKIISVGRSHWIKGYNFALDAMNILKERGIDFQYTIIGGMDEELIYQVADLDLKNFVELAENVPFEKVKSMVYEADVLLLSSVAEGIPNVVLEAMALGTLAVSTECGGVSEVIEDGKNGFLVPIRNPQSIAKKIETILEYSNEELNSIRMNARETIEKQHNHQKMVDDMLALYTSLK